VINLRALRVFVVTCFDLVSESGSGAVCDLIESPFLIVIPGLDPGMTIKMMIQCGGKSF